MKALKLPKAVLGALEKFGVLEDELLAVVNQAKKADGSLEDGGEAVKSFIVDKVKAHLSLEAAEAIGASVVAQVLGGKPGFDPDHSQDA